MGQWVVGGEETDGFEAYSGNINESNKRNGEHRVCQKEDLRILRQFWGLWYHFLTGDN